MDKKQVPKKAVFFWLICVGALILFVANAITLGAAIFSETNPSPNLILGFLVSFAATMVLTGLICYLVLFHHRETQITTDALREEKERTGNIQTHLKILSSLLRIGTLHSQHMEISRLLNNIAEVIRESLDADQVSLMLLDAGDNRLRTKAVSGEYGPELEHIWKASLGISEAIAGFTAAKGESLLLDEKTDFSRFRNYITKLAPISSAMSVPLHSGTRIIGCININRLKPKRKSPYDRDDLVLLSIFAEDIAMAIENVQLTRELKKAKAFLEIGVTHATPDMRRDSQSSKEEEEEVANLPDSQAGSQPVCRPVVDGTGRSVLPPPSSHITTQKLQDDIMVVSIKRSDYFIGDQLEQTFNHLIEQGTTKFIVNLAEVDRINSMGIGAFTSLISPLEERHCRVILVQPNSQVRQALNLFGLQESFPIVDDLPTALKALTE